MFGYDMMARSPSVTTIHAHLHGENNVMYPSDATEEVRRQCAAEAVSDLMRHFQRPSDDIFNPLIVLDYFETYTITKKKKDDLIPSSPPPGKWLDSYGNIVSARKSSHVCRIKFQSPAVGDLFYLRLILHSTPGRSYTDLRTAAPPSGIPTEYASFHDAARARGLVSRQEDFFICMDEAITFEMPSQLRGLFVILILDGGPAPKLWHDYKEHLIEDFNKNARCDRRHPRGVANNRLEIAAPRQDKRSTKPTAPRPSTNRVPTHAIFFHSRGPNLLRRQIRAWPHPGAAQRLHRGS